MADFEDKHLDFVLKHYKEDRFNTQKAISRFNEAHGVVHKPRRRIMPWIYGAVTAAAVVLGVFLFLGEEAKPVELKTVAQSQIYILPDGTEITLAPGSMLSYKENSPRNVSLEGKAFFDVARDEAVPFEISLDGAFVKVLGTEFLVDASQPVKEVYVTDGKVFFAKTSDSEGVTLTKDMMATLSEYDSVPVIAVNPDVNVLAWQRGTFIFDKTPLRDVLKTLSEYYKVSFAATDLNKQLSGEFYTEDLDMIINIIESALDVTIIRK